MIQLAVINLVITYGWQKVQQSLSDAFIMSNTRFNKNLCYSCTGGLREVKISLAKELAKQGCATIPGQKICPPCYIRSKESAGQSALGKNIEDNEGCLSVMLDEELSYSADKDALNATLNELDVSPLKLHAVAQHSKASHGKRKLKQANEALSKKFASVLEMESEQLVPRFENPLQNDLIEKARDLDKLVDQMKMKLTAANRRERIQILTLIPESWSVRKAAAEFNVSKKTVLKAKKLKKEMGIIAMPNRIEGKKIAQEMMDSVIKVYCDDEFSRTLPGKKDFVSVSKNQHMPKRLILCNLKELYAAYKANNITSKKVSFSKFASLRPKWCISVGAKGTHSVCVCTIHQNTKLMLDAANLDSHYKELVDMIVCDEHSKECMVHRCRKCPGIESLHFYLTGIFTRNKDQNESENDDDSDDDEELKEMITYKQWTTTDRSELISQTATLEEFIDEMCDKLDRLTVHSYIAKSQATYLKGLKSAIGMEEVIVLGDFAENYKFLIQDEIQSYHWNQRQCTLHPIVLYYKCNESAEVSSKSLCVISDDLEHDVNMVYAVITETINCIKETISSDIKLVHYFTDGCTAQYKNCKNFWNLCHHEQDFGMQGQWNFFATSHGKSPCDGIGGTVKRLTARASLQRPSQEQILTADDMFAFCQQEIKGIDFKLIRKDDVDETRKKLKSRLELAKTIPGTRSYHQFIPITNHKIGAKRISEDKEFVLEYHFIDEDEPNVPCLEICPNNVVVCKYDGFEWLGIALELDKENGDIHIKFMHPHFPTASFSWPVKDDVCWVPNQNVLAIVEAPAPTTVTGRQYSLNPDDIANINERTKYNSS